MRTLDWVSDEITHHEHVFIPKVSQSWWARCCGKRMLKVQVDYPGSCATEFGINVFFCPHCHGFRKGFLSNMFVCMSPHQNAQILPALKERFKF